MVTQSLYLMGGAGTGKSTFMAQLLERMDFKLGALEDLHARIGGHGRAVTLRGHAMKNGDTHGYYLGVMREGLFPGTDALERVSHGPAADWVRAGNLPPVIVSEGATLAVRPFLNALHEHTDALILAFRCEPWVHELRLLERGTGQAESFVASSITRTENLARDLTKAGAAVHWVDADDPHSWERALQSAEIHLGGLI